MLKKIAMIVLVLGLNGCAVSHQQATIEDNCTDYVDARWCGSFSEEEVSNTCSINIAQAPNCKDELNVWFICMRDHFEHLDTCAPGSIEYDTCSNESVDYLTCADQ